MKGNFEIYPLVPPCTFNLKVDLIRYYLDKSISKNNITIIVFGICHPQMLKALAKYGDKVVRVKASNCYEMYLGKEKYEEFHKKSYFMLTKLFFTNFKKDLLLLS